MGNQFSSGLSCCETVPLPQLFYKLSKYEQQLEKYLVKFPAIKQSLNKIQNSTERQNQMFNFKIDKNTVTKFNLGIYIGSLNENNLPQTMNADYQKNKLKQKGIFLYQIKVKLNQQNHQSKQQTNKNSQKLTLNGTISSKVNEDVKIKGFFYEGQMKNGQRNGYGRIINDQGSYYQGYWNNNKAVGSGIYVSAQNKSTYEGNFLDGLPHGYGVQVFEDGSKYQGNFINGLKSGKGRFSYPDQTFYEGQFHENQIQGYGISESKYHKYYGQWKEGKMHGNGISTWYNGNKEVNGVYIGEYQHGLKHGFGEYRWGDKKVYKGKWLEGQMKSQGVLLNYD